MSSNLPAHQLDILDDYCRNGGTILDWCGLHGVKYSELERFMRESGQWDKWVAIVDRVDTWTIHRVYQEVKRLATSDIREAYDESGALKDIHDMPGSVAACIAAVESIDEYDDEGNKTGTVRKVKLWDKMAALKLIGGQLSMFESKVPTAEEIVGFAEKLAKAIERARRPVTVEITEVKDADTGAKDKA